MKIICILVPLLLLLPPGCGNVLDLRAKSFIHVYYTQRMPWTRAQAYCRVHYTDLVTIRDESENLGFFHGWIGLYREDSALEWKWSRGDKRANFTIWGHSKQGSTFPSKAYQGFQAFHFTSDHFYHAIMRCFCFVFCSIR